MPETVLLFVHDSVIDITEWSKDELRILETELLIALGAVEDVLEEKYDG